MEYVPGATLDAYVATFGPLTEIQVRLFAWALAEALQDIHSAGVVHRDLKPGNVILSPTGPKVLDFGIAQTRDATTLTTDGQRSGSLRWMSPEQLQGGPITAAADVYAWGALVYFAATGQSPHGAGPSEAVAWRAQQSPVDVSDLTTRIPDLAPTVSAALQRQPQLRPSTVDLVRQTRQESDPERTTISHETDVTAALAALWSIEPSSVDTGPSAALHDWGRRRRTRRFVTGASVAVGLAMVAILGGMIVTDGDSQRPPLANTAPTAFSQPPAGTTWMPWMDGYRASDTTVAYATLIRQAYEQGDLPAPGGGTRQIASPSQGGGWAIFKCEYPLPADRTWVACKSLRNNAGDTPTDGILIPAAVQSQLPSKAVATQ